MADKTQDCLKADHPRMRSFSYAWSLPVTWQKWRSYYSIPRTRQLCGFMFYRTGDIEVFHCENKDFRPFCSCDLDLDPMTFIYELDPYSLDHMCENELIRQGFRKLSCDRHTDIQTDTTEIIYSTPLRGWSVSLMWGCSYLRAQLFRVKYATGVPCSCAG